MSLIQDIYSLKMWCTTGNSDKVYHVTIREYVPAGVYDVEVDYGRRGNNLIRINKASHVSLRKAHEVLNKLKNEKTNKGYQITSEVDTSETPEVKWRRRIQMAKFRLAKLRDQKVFIEEQYQKLKGMIASDEEETITLAEAIISQKLQVGDL